tara:strand:- start:71949 stop:72452 length:504 start_codon:yes stop_codon:yes gene_type:complete
MQYSSRERTKTTKLLLIGLISSAILLSACSGSRPTDIGISNGQLLPCPESPNCVNSRSNNQIHAIKAIHFKQPISQAEAILAVKEALMTLPDIEIIKETQTYLYAEARSKIMRFVDDVEFLFPNNDMIQEVHVRSASRLGYKDFDVNRLRIESIRAKLIEEGLAVRE